MPVVLQGLGYDCCSWESGTEGVLADPAFEPLKAMLAEQEAAARERATPTRASAAQKARGGALAAPVAQLLRCRAPVPGPAMRACAARLQALPRPRALRRTLRSPSTRACRLAVPPLPCRLALPPGSAAWPCRSALRLRLRHTRSLPPARCLNPKP